MKRWKLWSGLVALFLSGVLIGAVSGGFYVRQSMKESYSKWRPPARELVMKKLTGELELDDEQRVKIGKIVCRIHEQIREVRRRSRPELEKILDEGIILMKAELSAEQQEKLDVLHEKVKKRYRRDRDARMEGNGQEPCD